MAMIYDMDNEYGAYIIGDGGEKSTGTLEVKSGAAGTPAVAVSRTAVGSQSVAPLKIVGSSVASGAAIEFANKSFISITSVVLTTVANTDYAIPVQVGLETRYIPTFKAAALIGGAAF